MANPHPNFHLILTGGRGGLGQAFPQDALRLSTRLESSSSTWVEDLRRAKAGRPACLIHMAAMTLVDACEKDPQACFEMNVDHTVRLYEAAAQAGLDRFVFVSTSHVYAPSDQPVATDARLGARSMYPRSKLLAETLLRSAERLVPGAPRLSVARVFSLIGPGMKSGFLYPNLVARAQHRDASPLPGFHNVRDFVPTHFAASKLVQLAQSTSFPSLANICTGQGTRVGDLAAEVYREHGADVSLVKPAEGRPSDTNYQVGLPTEFT